MATLYEIFRDCYIRKHGCQPVWFDMEMLSWYWEYEIYMGE